MLFRSGVTGFVGPTKEPAPLSRKEVVSMMAPMIASEALKKASVRYFMLVLVLLACNYFLLSSLVAIGLGLVLAKLLTETLLFLISYRVQHNLVFA